MENALPSFWMPSQNLPIVHWIQNWTLVLAGMERARQRGERIGRPRVSDEPGFEARFSEVLERINAGELSRRKAALELGIGYATLKRLIAVIEPAMILFLGALIGAIILSLLVAITGLYDLAL